MEILNLILIIFIIACAVAVSFTKNLLSSIIIFMAQSVAMSVVWVILRSPDLGITEAAVGAGVTTLLMFVTLKELGELKDGNDEEK